MNFFFYLGFLSRKFTIYRTAGEGGGYLFNSSLPLPPASQTLRYQPGDYWRELTSAHSQQPYSAPTRVEFLFRVLPFIGVLFRVATPYSSIPLRITLRSCQGEMQKHGSSCLVRKTMSLQIISLQKFIPKGRIENFYSV